MRMSKLLVALKQRTLDARRRLATFGVALLLAVVGYYVVFGANNGLFVYQKKRSESRSLDQQIQTLRNQNLALEQQIKALKSDPQTIEKEARERLRYARPGEVIYTLAPPRPDPGQSKK